MTWSFHPEAEIEFHKAIDFYSIETDGVFILAVMHLHRHPDYWKQRK